MNLIPNNLGTTSPFDRIRRRYADGREYWSSRELALVLGYTNYSDFLTVVKKSKMTCFKNGISPTEHFDEVETDAESCATVSLKTVLLSRYACYLTILASDPNLPTVAHGHSYFAIETRRQELADEEPEKDLRVQLRVNCENIIRVFRRLLKWQVSRRWVFSKITGTKVCMVD